MKITSKFYPAAYHTREPPPENEGVPLPEFIIYIRFQLIPNPLETWRLLSSSCSSSFCFFRHFLVREPLSWILTPLTSSHLLYSNHRNHVPFSNACLCFLVGIDNNFIIFYDNEIGFQNHINAKTENRSWTQIPSSLHSDFPAFSMGNCTTFPFHVFRGQP